MKWRTVDDVLRYLFSAFVAAVLVALVFWIERTGARHDEMKAALLRIERNTEAILLRLETSSEAKSWGP